MDSGSEKKLSARIKRMSRRIFSRQVGVFLIFLVISTMLWFVTSLNEQVQRQIDYKLNIRGVPDTVTFINEPPSVITVNVRGRGTDLLRNMMGSQPVINLDFSRFAADNRFALSKRVLLDIIQSAVGDDRQVMNVIPDSIGLYYTSLPPVKLPVKVEVTATTTPSVCLYGPITASVDSVLVYSTVPVSRNMRYVSTAETHFNDISATTTKSVRIAVPEGFRAVPPVVDVTIRVEPVITVDRQIDIELVNVPSGVDCVLETSKVKASFRVPQSQKNKLPEIHVIADYSVVPDSVTQGKIGIQTSQLLPNVFLETDSVEFYIPSVSIEPSMSAHVKKKK